MSAWWGRVVVYALLSVACGALCGGFIDVWLRAGGIFTRIGATAGAALSPIAAACLWRKGLGAACLWVFAPTLMISLLSTPFIVLVVFLQPLAVIGFYLLMTFVAWFAAKDEWPLTPPANRCWCGYDLAGIPDGVCPECGPQHASRCRCGYSLEGINAPSCPECGVRVRARR